MKITREIWLPSLAIMTLLLQGCATMQKKVHVTPPSLPSSAKVSELETPIECEPSCLEYMQRWLDTRMSSGEKEAYVSDGLSSAGNLMLVLCAWVLHKTGLPIEQVSILGALLALDYFTGIGKSLATGRPVTSRIGWVGLLS